MELLLCTFCIAQYAISVHRTDMYSVDSKNYFIVISGVVPKEINS